MPSNYHNGNLREALLERTIETLGLAGIEKLSLRALVRGLCAGHAAPFGHFKTKADQLSATPIEGAQSVVNSVPEGNVQEAGTRKLLGISLDCIDWAIQPPTHYQVLRNPDVLRRAPKMLEKRVSELVGCRRAEIAHAQAKGWRSQEGSQNLFLPFSALTVGAAMTTVLIYFQASGIITSRDRLFQLIKSFLKLSDQTGQRT